MSQVNFPIGHIDTHPAIFSLVLSRFLVLKTHLANFIHLTPLIVICWKIFFVGWPIPPKKALHRHHLSHSASNADFPSNLTQVGFT